MGVVVASIFTYDILPPKKHEIANLTRTLFVSAKTDQALTERHTSSAATENIFPDFHGHPTPMQEPFAPAGNYTRAPYLPRLRHKMGLILGLIPKPRLSAELA